MEPASPSQSPNVESAAIAAARRMADEYQDVLGDAPAALPRIPGYELLNVIRAGGQGIVYRGIQISTGRNVAVKLIRGEHALDRESNRRFDREVQILAVLNHPNIVTVHDAGLVGGQHFYAMDFVEGVCLDEFIRQRSLSVSQTMQLFQRICEAMGAAHLLGVVHRDLKPTNILIEQESGGPRILDFGLAKFTRSTDLHEHSMTVTGAGRFVGSLPWASPEQLNGSATYADPRTDVYAIGLMMYQALTGQMPFGARLSLPELLDKILHTDPVRPSFHRREIDADVDTIVLTCLDTEPAGRYADARALAEDIRRYLNNEPIEAKKSSTWYVLRKQVHRHRKLVGVLVLLAVVLASAAVVSTAAWRSERSARQREETARIRADDLALNLRQQLYVKTFMAAAGAFQENELTRARALLKECPEEHRGWEWSRLNCVLDESIRVFHGHTREAQSIAVSSDGSIAVSGGIDGRVLQWDLASGVLLRELFAHPNTIDAVAIDPTDRFAVAGSFDGALTIIDLDTKEVRPVAKLEHQVNCIAWLNADRFVASTSVAEAVFCRRDNDHDFMCHRWPSGKLLEELQGFSQAVLDGQFALVATPGRVTLVDVLLDKVIETFPLGQARPITGFAMHPNKRTAAISADDKVEVVDFNVGKKSCSWSAPGRCDLLFTPDGAALITGGQDDLVKEWDFQTCTTTSVWHGHDLAIVDFAWKPGSKELLSASADGSLRLWDVSKPGCTYAISAADFRETGGTICFGRDVVLTLFNGLRDTAPRFFMRLALWDFKQRELRFNRFVNEVGNIRIALNVPDGSAALSPDNSLAAAVGDEYAILLIDARSGDTVGELRGHSGIIKSMAFSPDGSKLASASDDGSVRVWDVASRQPVHVFNDHVPYAWAVVFDPSGKRLFSGGWDRCVRVWDVATGEQLMTLRDFPSYVMALAISPDGRMLVAGGASGEGFLQAWDATTGAPLRRFHRHERDVYMVAFSPDGKRLFSAGADARIKVWLPQTGECVYTIPMGQLVTSFAISPDGRRLAVQHDELGTTIMETK